MIELYFIFNGHRRYYLGNFIQAQDAIDALKAHQKNIISYQQSTFSQKYERKYYQD